jgi:hypothetical protein
LIFFKKHFAFLTALFVFFVYLITLAPSVVEIDSGELATVQSTLGIAHPTGYPLFTIAGYLFSKIPLPTAKIFQLNILSAFWCSLAVGLFAFIVKFILDNLFAFSAARILIVKTNEKEIKSKNTSTKIQKVNKDIPETIKYLIAILSALILTFDKTYWLQSTSVNVYSLQAFLFILIIFSVLIAYVKNNSSSFLGSKNHWLMVAAAFALGFSNHMSTIFLLPGAAYLFFDKNGFNKKSFVQIGIMILLFISIVIIFYSYFPIRSAQKPILNWGDPISFSKLLKLMVGKQYKIWPFSSEEAASINLSYLFTNLPSEFWVSIIFSIIGFFVVIIKARKLFIFIAINLLFTVLYTINFEIHNVTNYFLLAYISITFFAVFGIIQIFSFLKAQKYSYLLPSALVILFIIVEATLNFKEINQNDNYTFNDYTKNILKFGSKNSIILTYEWDFFVSASYYFQYVENYRQDICVIAVKLLRKSWYYKQLNTDHPKLFAEMQDGNSFLLNDVSPFEKEVKFDNGAPEKYNFKILNDSIVKNISKHDIFITPELFDIEMQKGEFNLPKGYTLVPEIFNFKVVKGNNYVPAPDPNFILRLPKKRNYYINFIESNVGSMLARRALYEMQFDKIDRAKLYIKKIKTDFPDYFLPAGLEQVLER